MPGIHVFQQPARIHLVFLLNQDFHPEWTGITQPPPSVQDRGCVHSIPGLGEQPPLPSGAHQAACSQVSPGRMLSGITRPHALRYHQAACSQVSPGCMLSGM
ncbi:Hypothetical predicted protein [Pelobates cultripes]|uniref:Uncharacterized protein n=1 Tax=Pelobates cultripes TaxID=61616 RepID=A0AAD1VSP4_PELCU|nr:Hypothetical predicted protein [Pelobates cultripes]